MSHHTSVRLSNSLHDGLNEQRLKRNLGSFSNAIQEAVRFYITHHSEIQAVEQRIASSVERLSRQIKTVQQEQRATFALQLALAQEMLSHNQPAAVAEQRLKRVLRNGMADFHGKAEEFLSPPEPEMESPPPVTEEVPF